MDRGTIEIIVLIRDFAALVIRYFPNLKWTSVPCKHRRSIVRAIGSALPMSPINRVYTNINSFLCNVNEISHEDNKSNEWRSPDAEMLCSTPKQWDGKKIEELEIELSKLREQVSLILSYHMQSVPDEKEKSCTWAVSVASQSTERSSLPPLPPIPPPPPPPLPSFTFTKDLQKISKQKRGNIHSPKVQKNALNDVLKELTQSRPTLRHVKLSPGGRPIRSPKVHQDPAKILAEALKQRFNSMNSYESPNKSDLSCSFSE